MAEHRAIHEKIGKYTHGNPISFPTGAAKEVENFEAIRDNVYRICRGRNNYGENLPAQDIKQIMEYKKRVHLHMGNDTIYYDSNGTGLFALLGTTLIQPDATTLMHELEFAGNMYFTTSSGVKLFDTLGGAALDAGEPRGLSCDVRLTTGSTWLANAYAVSYRHVWTYIDANNNKTTGSPSERTDISNSTGGSRSVTLGIYIPAGITTSHMLEVYRSTSVTPITVTPPEDYQLCYTVKPTAGQLTAKYLEFEDLLPDGFKGLTLYTNTTQEGLAQANENPPLCKAIDKYRGFVFFADVIGLSRLYTAMIATTNLTAATSTIKINDGTHSLTFGCVTEIAAKTAIATAAYAVPGPYLGMVELQTSVAHTMATGDYVHVTEINGTVEANGIWEIVVTAADKMILVTCVYVHAWAASANNVVAQYEDYNAAPRFIKFTTGTTAQNIDNTARSFVKCINLASTNSWWYAYYTSSVSDPPGKIMITGRDQDNVQFYLIANSAATGSGFSPQIPTAGTTYISSSSAFTNGLMFCKEQQAEHVPLVNILYVGSQNDKILRIIGLKDSLIIVKENDGIWRLTGTNPSNFLVTELDGTCKCLQKESVYKGDNAVFMMSNQGKVKISDAGVEVIGRDNEYLDLKPTKNTSFSTTGYGWYYPTEKNYYLSTMKDETSTTFDTVSVYNTFTQGWTDRKYGVTTNDTQIRAAKVIDDVCYYAPLTGNKLLKERKSFTTADFRTPDISCTIINVDLVTNQITLAAAITITKGARLVQGAFSSVVTSVIDTVNFLVVDAASFINGAATIYPGIISRIKYHQCHCNMPDISKDFKELVLLFDDAETNIENIELIIYTDLVKAASTATNMQGTVFVWGMPDWGMYWLNTTVTDKWRTLFPADYSTGSYCYLEVQHTNADSQVALCGYTVEFDANSHKIGKE